MHTEGCDEAKESARDASQRGGTSLHHLLLGAGSIHRGRVACVLYPAVQNALCAPPHSLPAIVAPHIANSYPPFTPTLRDRPWRKLRARPRRRQ